MIAAHTITAVAAIIFGALIVLLPKGTNRHRAIGWGFVASMGAMVIISIPIRQINDGAFSLFHLISIQVALFVGLGIGASRFRRRVPGWVVWHARFMLYGFVTLVVTGVAQGFHLLPFANDVVNAIIFLQLPAIVGWALIEFVGIPRWRVRFAPRQRAAQH